MTNPERIHIVWNASDGYDTFIENGIDAKLSNPPTKTQITSVLAKQEGRLFRLLGWIDKPVTDVSLEITGSIEETLLIKNENEPQFIGGYYVADEPPPWMTHNGDYIFDLVISLKSS